MTDSGADNFIFYALFAFAASCVHPAMGLLLQFPAIIYLVKRCDMKALPALLVLMLGKGNVKLFGVAGDFALRLGITLTPSSLFAISAFIFTIFRLLKNRYDRGAMGFSIVWLLSAIPAFVISFQGKRYGLSGAWSAPVMSFLAPGVYYWGLSMACTYEAGKEYFIKRMILVLFAFEVLYLGQVIYVFTFFHGTLLLCLAIYVIRDKQNRWGGFNALAPFCILTALAVMLFARRIQMDEAIALEHSAMDLASGDKLGSTFSAMFNMLLAFVLAVCGRMLSRGMIRILPVLMVAFNIAFVSYAIITQSGNKAREVNLKYETLAERFEAKLFGDRASVWTMGWEEIKTPPYIFKDMRQAYVYEHNGKQGAKLLPHNQFITLLARCGLWLGGILSIFIIWVWVRACKAMTFMMDDWLICTVFIPVGLGWYFIGGITGQSVVTGDLWAHSLTCLVLPGVIYGHWIDRQRSFVYAQAYDW
jgi:hypothetical protein